MLGDNYWKLSKKFLKISLFIISHHLHPQKTIDMEITPRNLFPPLKAFLSHKLFRIKSRQIKCNAFLRMLNVSPASELKWNNFSGEKVRQIGGRPLYFQFPNGKHMTQGKRVTRPSSGLDDTTST